ncbi:hypothetical protein EAI_02181, partial [Harpegnathos saltator]
LHERTTRFHCSFQQQVDADFSNKIIFSDEADFHLDGLVNRQNCRITCHTARETIQLLHESFPRRV